jgi:outer membrane protein TolC
LNLFNGGRDYLQEKSRLANVERAQAEFEESKFGTLTQVRTLYWQMIYQKEVINILESSLKLNEKNLESALKKIRSNLATKTDEIDFNQTKIQLEQDLKRSKIILSNHMRELAAILNHSIDTLYEIPALNHHEPEHTLDDFQSRGFNGEGHREIKKIEALKLSTEFQSKAASRWWTPQLDLYASKIRRLDTLAVRNEVDRDPGEVLGFKLTFSFDGFQDRANSVAQSYMSMSFDYLRNQRLQEIQSGYSNSYQLYILNHDLVHSAEENNKVAQRYYESIWSEYMRGIKNSPDVLQAFQRIVEAKIRYADIKKDYQVARAQIMGYLQE